MATTSVMIDCAVCNGETTHLDMGNNVPRSVRFKCKRCGEYNMQKTIADGIMEPLKHVWESLHRLEAETQDIPVAQPQVGMIVGELEGAMAVVRRSVESLLEATMGPEEDEDAPVPGGENYTLIRPDKNQSSLKYGFNPGAGCDEVSASNWEEPAEPTQYDVGYESEEDFSDVLYMTALREDGKEK